MHHLVNFLKIYVPKRGRASREKASGPKKQTEISNYWLGNSETSTSENSNRFEISNTIDQESENNLTNDKYPKSPQIFIDCVSNIKPLYEVLDKVAKDLYDRPSLNSTKNFRYF